MRACGRQWNDVGHDPLVTDFRLPAHVEVSALMRATESAGGFAMVLHKGERDAGTILIVIVDKQGLGQLFERLPQVDGTRSWTKMQSQIPESKNDFNDYLARRSASDPDLWIIELTIADGERLILQGTAMG
jgi:hypothetical protein